MRRHLSILCLLLFALAAWGQQVRQLTVSPALPAASGSMGVSHDTSGTTYINLQVKHLASSESLHPAKTVYVVWIQPTGQPPQNHGALQVNHKEEAKYSTITKAPNFEVFVTPEDNPKATTPTGPRLLSARY